MTFDYPLKMEIMNRLIRDAKRQHDALPPGDDKESAALLVDLLTGIKETVTREHLYSHVAVEHEAPPPIRNKGGRPRDPVQPGAMAS